MLGSGDAHALVVQSAIVVAPAPAQVIEATIDFPLGTDDLEGLKFDFVYADGKPARLSTVAASFLSPPAARFATTLERFGPSPAGGNYVTDVSFSLLDADGGVAFELTRRDVTISTSSKGASYLPPPGVRFSSALISFGTALDDVGFGGDPSARIVITNAEVLHPPAPQVPLPPAGLLLLGGVAGLATLRRARTEDAR